MAEAEVEVAFTIERSREKGGGLNLKVFGIGAEGSGKEPPDARTSSGSP